MNRSQRFLFDIFVVLGMLSSCDSSSNSTNDTVVAPVFSPAGGTYSVAQTVAMASSTSGATIYYTTDGSAPTISSTKYTTPVSVSATQTLNAIAVKSGLTTSSVSLATYTITSGGSGSTTPWNTSVSYGSLSYEGQTYKTVVIGTQTWMAENLNYKVDSSWWYANSADSGARYGRLYTWASAMKLPDSCNIVSCASQVQSKHQGECPSGWHIPSDAEWSTLATYLGGAAAAGSKLKSTSGWSYDGVTGNGTDSYGFRALPAGNRLDHGSFYNVGRYARFWSSSELVANDAWYRYLYMGDDGLYRNHYFKKYGYSVRCLKD
jgi:uncharacterized protein (TIGR02145 family)